MDIQDLQLTLRRFAAERNWQPFHTPKNLAMALMVEAAELQEIYQWMTPEQSQSAHQDAMTKQRIGEEVADVLLYLIQLADHSELDLDRAVSRKIVKNADKYPPVNSMIPSGKGAMVNVPIHVLIDWENVQPKESDIQVLVPGATDVWVFHGQNQKLDKTQFASFGDRATRIPITRPGKNALDFHLSFYMGYIASRSPDARIVVVSNDKGYGPMLDHAVDLGFAANQIGFANPKTVPAKKVPTSKPKAQPVAKVSAPTPKSKTVVAKPQTATQETVPTPAPAAKKSTPAKKTSTPVNSTATAKKSAIATSPAASKSAENPAAKPTKKATSTGKKATKQASPAVATPKPQAKKAPPLPTSTTIAVKKVATPKKVKIVDLPLEDRAKLVLTSILKSANKPTRKARLLGSIKSLLNVPTGDPLIDAVLQHLLATGDVTVSDSGAVSFAVSG